MAGCSCPRTASPRAVRAVAAQLARAAERGATVRDRTEVLDILTTGDRVTGVRTSAGDLPADIVVCCAGIWGPTVAGMVGQTLALTPLAHQFAWTGPVTPLRGRRTEAVRPVLRHQDADLYYRENGERLGIGSYRHRPMPVRPVGTRALEQLRRRRPVASRRCCEFTPDDFTLPAGQETGRLLPGSSTCTANSSWPTRSTGCSRSPPTTCRCSGRTRAWTASGRPRRSGSPTRPGWPPRWPSGSSTATSSFDLHACDLNRFETHQLAPAYIEAKDCQNFVEVYDILHPLQPMEHSRPLRTSPFYPRQQELGAVFLEANGWERPHWYAANDGLLASDRNTGWHVPSPDDWAGRFWSPIVAAEAAVTRTDVALYDMTALKRLEVTGPGATTFLQSMVTGKIDKSVGVGHLLPDARRRRRRPLRRHGGPAGRRAVPGRGEREPRSGLAASPSPQVAAGGHGAGPGHHRRYLLHRHLGAASPRRWCNR